MDKVNATAILRAFSAHRQAANNGAAKRWQWNSGVILFPDAICPWCDGVMRSNRIWLVSRTRLNGQVTIVDNKLVKEVAEHPHVANGSICMGGASDAITALFLSLSVGTTGHSHLKNKYPHDWVRRWHAWQAKMFDHDCKAKGRAGELSHKLSDEMAQLDAGAVEQMI